MYTSAVPHSVMALDRHSLKLFTVLLCYRYPMCACPGPAGVKQLVVSVCCLPVVCPVKKLKLGFQRRQRDSQANVRNCYKIFQKWIWGGQMPRQKQFSVALQRRHWVLYCWVLCISNNTGHFTVFVVIIAHECPLPWPSIAIYKQCYQTSHCLAANTSTEEACEDILCNRWQI